MSRVRGGAAAFARRVEEMTSVSELRRLFRYDAETGDLWVRCSIAPRSRYGQAKVKGACLSQHRIIWCLLTGSWPVGEVDHIDGNTRNNRPGNLREATASVNMHNSRRAPNSTSGFRGVHRAKSNRRFSARICVNGIYHRKGKFETPQAAAAWLEAKAFELGVSRP